MALPDGSLQPIMYQDSLLLNDLQVARTNVVKRMPIADILNNRPNKFLYSLEVEVDLSRVTTEEVENIPEDIELDFYFDLEMVLSGSTPGIYFKDTGVQYTAAFLYKIKSEDLIYDYLCKSFLHQRSCRGSRS